VWLTLHPASLEFGVAEEVEPLVPPDAVVVAQSLRARFEPVEANILEACRLEQVYTGVGAEVAPVAPELSGQMIGWNNWAELVVFVAHTRCEAHCMVSLMAKAAHFGIEVLGKALSAHLRHWCVTTKGPGAHPNPKRRDC
jgi:hypothetical protein